jgi:hypothetical protein
MMDLEQAKNLQRAIKDVGHWVSLRPEFVHDDIADLIEWLKYLQVWLEKCNTVLRVRGLTTDEAEMLGALVRGFVESAEKKDLSELEEPGEGDEELY